MSDARDSRLRVISTYMDSITVTYENGDVNEVGRLIAAAPELAEALKIVLGYLIDDGPVRTEDGAIAVARAALEKAGLR